jgi:hypothetical protein
MPVQPTSETAAALATELRRLRRDGLPGIQVTQAQLATALGVTGATVSSWESQKNPVVMPPERIEEVATFYCSTRSMADDSPRLLAVADLTTAERERRSQVLATLRGLRDQATAELDPTGGPIEPVSRILRGGPWHFSKQRPVTIACAPLSKKIREGIEHADPTSPDYSMLHTLGDPDALLELYGHIRAVNPENPVYVRDAQNLRPEDYTENLVLLGGVDENALLRKMMRLLQGIPVHQAGRDDDSIGGFQATQPDGTVAVFRPVAEPNSEQIIVEEDVAHFFRGPNPYNQARTVTICNGQFARGTYGVVRALTDPKFRDRNAAYLATRFGSSSSFSILCRVSMDGYAVHTPDWTAPGTVLHEWSSDPA